MDAVLAEFGEPLARIKPVGDPPITRWEYAEFIVNFERRWVIHSAIKAKRRILPEAEPLVTAP
jgi:hypothetical protein